MSSNEIRMYSYQNDSIQISHSDNKTGFGSFDVFAKENSIYYTNVRHGDVHSYNLRTEQETIQFTYGSPKWISVDWITGNFYFINDTKTNKTISACRVDQHKCAKIFDLDDDSMVSLYE